MTGRARIMAPPDVVWRWLAEPRGWPAWNPKLAELLPLSLDAPRAGWRFRMSYRLSRRAHRFEAEIVEFLPCERLVCRTRGGDLAPGGEVLERYELSSDEDSTLLTHRVDLTDSRMPFFARLAAVGIARLLNSRGELGHVRNLKALIEDGVPPPGPA